jgi:lysyl-tRNA synthetase class 2
MAGRVRSVRQLGSKLLFLDIERDAQRLQVMVDVNKLEPREHLVDDFKSSKKTLRIGDWVCKYCLCPMLPR